MNLFRLKGKIAVITGGAGRLGSEFADTLAQVGAHVVILDRSEGRGRRLVIKLAKRYPSTSPLFLPVDLSDSEKVQTAIVKITKRYSKIDVLINNATDFKAKKKFFESFENYNLEDWKKVTETNIHGLFIVTQAVAQQMIKQKRGVIINTGSIYGMVSPHPGIYASKHLCPPLVYATTKSAMYNFTRYLATYLAPYHIRVNIFTPGGLLDNQEKRFVKNYCKRTPLNRMANKEDYRGPILFLASDASRYMTGANLVVDGGWTCW